MMNSYLDLNFEVTIGADNSTYANVIDIKLVKLNPVALLSNCKLTTNGGKHLEDTSHANIVSLLYTLKTSAKDSDDLSIGFDRKRNRRQRELTNNRKIKA